MFRDDEQGVRLAALCDEVARAPGSELVLLGDIFDLTAAQAPAKGLEAFARALDLPLDLRPMPPLPEVMRSIRECNPLALGALEKLAAMAPVTFVPGNHDRHL